MTYYLVEYLRICKFPENQCCIVLRASESKRILPVWIHAADAIDLMRNEGDPPPRRPYMVDVLIELADLTANRFTKVRVDSYFAGDFIVYLITGNGEELECRLSDALEVAYLLNLPIMVSEDVLAQASVFISKDDLETWLEIQDVEDLMEASWEESASGDAAADADFSKLMESMGVSEADLLGSDDQPSEDSDDQK